MNLRLALNDLPQPAGSGRHLLAYSGGLDSTVLLDLLADHPRVVDLYALHVNHGMQGQAQAWQDHCHRQCQRLGVDFRALPVTVDTRGQGPEAAARAARYRALREQMRPGDVLLTAQHADDQAETFLLQALRGAGVAGLAGMPRVTAFGQGRLARPLLRIERQTIRAHAENRGLEWVMDPSNQDPSIARGWLRTQIGPALHQRWPAATRALTRSSQYCGEAAELIDSLAAIDHGDCAGPENTLSVSALVKLSQARRANVLRFWLRQMSLAAPDHRQLHQLQVDLLAAREDATPCMHWSGVELRRHDGHLFAMTALPALPNEFEQAWDGRSVLNLPAGCGRLRATCRQGWSLDRGPFMVCLRRGGERIPASDTRPSQSLKNWLQERGVPPWVRERMPLIYANGQLLAVGGLWCADAQAEVAIEWLQPPPGAGWRRIVANPAFC